MWVGGIRKVEEESLQSVTLGQTYTYIYQVNKIDGAGATLFYSMYPYERLQQQFLPLLLLSRKSIVLLALI